MLACARAGAQPERGLSTQSTQGAFMPSAHSIFLKSKISFTLQECCRFLDIEDSSECRWHRTIIMFTATKLQVGTYLLGVCLFSIALLVFVNATISFIVTNIIHQKSGVGDTVGTLAFADELLALVACPLWGLFSDYAGACTVGYKQVNLGFH